MPALADLDFFEPELDDVLFPEALDADYPAPDPGLQLFPELPSMEQQSSAGQNPATDSTMMPFIGQGGNGPMMPLTPVSNGEEEEAAAASLSYFSPASMPMPFGVAVVLLV
ncbi:hypothetical protein SYNPS1DRAFT_23168 [Syncephalis pseudoplumigaleata]|uniref:Uncharacterized protein n=1 Tax=Syncephalis pseudoplumigaleata TaxID=1712513 RepID=A0A4P9YXJ1_9FUNG|nr:hypothetical protein SYNPS1DRAFT_23168 [Syncephalis pseudoplumigaleata]|eukprot:RKP24777.1 hypothetical protein SYNPS1DRAFT_23168 [Syncephalis pseudoplumigaleata]